MKIKCRANRQIAIIVLSMLLMTSMVATLTNVTSAVVTGRTYTLDADFDEGTLVGVEHETVHDQLQLNKTTMTVPFIWVPNSVGGTVSKVNTTDGKELGRYVVANLTKSSNPDPSRTTVDLQGNVWVGNRRAGTVVKIGLYEAGQYIDRNGNGIIETSRDTDGNGIIDSTEILPWGQDECVLYEVVLIPGYKGAFAPGAYTGPYDTNYWGVAPRGLAIDASNNLWAGTWSTQEYHHISGTTGQILSTLDVSPWGHSAYGAVIDGNGILWSARLSSHILRINTANLADIIKINLYHTYGIGLDYLGHLFVAGQQKLTRINITDTVSPIDWTKSAKTVRGVVCTPDNNVWVAGYDASNYYRGVSRYDNDGTHLITIGGFSSPSGVAVDAAGKVWVTDIGTEYIHRIDPTTNTTDLSKRIVGSGGHYTYSDMTGIVARSITTRIGTWTVDFDSGAADTPWGTISWTANEPNGTSVTVRVRSSNNKIIWSTWETATNGVPLTSTPNGRYLQIETTLQIFTGEVSPILYDLTVEIAILRSIDKVVYKKVKVIPAPVQFWREFIGGVTDIIVFDPPEITEPVALVREYTVLHEGQEPIPLEFLTWNATYYYPWEPIDTPENPYILPPDGIVEYDIPTLETDTAVLVRYTVAWASTPNIIEVHFINEAILESKSPQVIVGQLSNFDVHNDYHEPVDNFELELYGIQPSDIVDWFPGWGAPPQINPIPPSAGMPAGTEMIWMDPTQPVQPCHWEHFGLHLKPGVIAVGVKAYWTQRPSAELGDVIHTKIDVTVPPGETVTVVDTLPQMVEYITGTFTVDGVPATPTITTTSPPPPIITEISYTITTSGTHVIKFNIKADEAKSWEDTEVCNVVTATWYDEAGEEIETKEDVECFTIHAFEELHKNVGIPKADVVFAIDLTGSMGDEIAEVKTNATNIMNSLAAQIADVQFGLISFMDYNGTYSTTAPGSTPLTYTAQYGSAASGDYPYKLDQDIINNIPVMTAKINGLTLGWGADGPQDYTRIIHEAYNDSNLHWRTDAKRILILFGDNVPHDTDFDNDNDATADNTGGDPGRDTTLGTADDLDFETEVANAAANGVHVMAVYSGWAGEKFPWTYMANVTGGGYFELSEAEQIPDAIKDLIKKQAEATLTIKEKTEVQWAVVMDVVNPFSYTMKNVTIKDNFGAELEIDQIMASPDTNVDGFVDVFDLSRVCINYGTMALIDQDRWDPVADINSDGIVDMLDLSAVAKSLGLTLWTTGKSDKVHLFWYIGDLAPGETARIIILVSTDLNPAGHQEYTEPGIYEMNSGATLRFIDPLQDMQLSAVTDSIYVTVLPLEDP